MTIQFLDNPLCFRDIFNHILLGVRFSEFLSLYKTCWPQEETVDRSTTIYTRVITCHLWRVVERVGSLFRSVVELDLKSEKCERIDREKRRERERELVGIIYPTWDGECVRRKDMCDKEDKRRTIKRRMASRESASLARSPDRY